MELTRAWRLIAKIRVEKIPTTREHPGKWAASQPFPASPITSVTRTLKIIDFYSVLYKLSFLG
jgi:hypothetical protein